MMQTLCAKWYGSDEAMFGFGRDVAARAPAGDPVVAMLPVAYAEYICAVAMGASTDGPSPQEVILADQDAVMQASYKWAGDGSRPAPAHPNAVEAHNLFGWFFACTDDYQDRARWHLEQTGRRMSSSPWRYLGDDPSMVFAQVNAGLGLR